MRHPSRSEFIDLPLVRLHVRRWGDPAAPTLFLLHGWMDVSASFQFTVDALAREWNVVAPDWRGFGLSQRLHRPYYFADYVGDLDALLQRYTPDTPARLAGHSMGGIVSCLYGGIRPDRVAGIVTLEGFGIAPTTPDQAPGRFRKWLEVLKSPPAMHVYPSRAAFAQRLLRDDPYLTPERAAFLAEHLAADTDGGVVWNGDPWHKAPGPYLFQLDESMAVWQRVQCPVRWVAARDSFVVKEFANRPGDWEARRNCFAQVEECWIEQAGHMLHHDRPEETARLIEEFFRT